MMPVSANTDRAAFNAEQAAFVAALDRAHVRSFHSYFTQYVLRDDAQRYIAVDEGDYDALPQALLDRVVEAVPGKLSDEY
jgi:hypothetical protein